MEKRNANTYDHVRLNLKLRERDLLLSILDEQLTPLQFGDSRFSEIFRIRDRLAQCRVYHIGRPVAKDSQ